MTIGNTIIIGASRGIGAGLARELAQRGTPVVATWRTPGPELQALADANSQIAIETVDIDRPESIAALASRCAGHRFDCVFINAGIMHPPHQSADLVTNDELAALMLTNAIAPIRTARALVPLLADGGTLALMTSQLGSVAQRNSPALELYSASKAALNSLTRGLAAALPPERSIRVLSLHPGWVKTQMGGEEAPLTVAQSASGLADVIATSRDAGHYFLDYQGKTLPW